MKLYKKQQGFGAVEVLIIVLVLALVGLAGWWVWQKQHDKAKKANTSTQTQNANKDAVEPDSNSTQPIAAANGHLTIKEWKVRVKLSDKIADAYYVPAPNLPNVVYVSIAPFKGTGCAAEETSLAAYSRFTADYMEPYSDVKEIERHPDAVKIDDYYYAAVHPQAACSDNEATQQKAAAATDAFMQAAKTFEAAP